MSALLGHWRAYGAHHGRVASSLVPSGGTRAWRRLRASWQWRLEHVGPVFCRRCDQPVLADEPWHLGHRDDAPRAVGGEDYELMPEHAGCGMRAARRAREAKANDPAELPPSRVW